jgi:hypothetical protein
MAKTDITANAPDSATNPERRDGQEEVLTSAPPQPVAGPVEPSAGGSYLRQPDGSLKPVSITKSEIRE